MSDRSENRGPQHRDLPPPQALGDAEAATIQGGLALTSESRNRTHRKGHESWIELVHVSM